jgi:hypothetical protein
VHLQLFRLQGEGVEWSPDGKRVVYDCKHQEGYYNIHVCRADGTEDRSLAKAWAMLSWPFRPLLKRQSGTHCVQETEDENGSGRTLETFLLTVGFGDQCCSVPVVLDALDENWDSGTNQNKQADHAAFPIRRHPEKDQGIVDHGDQKHSDQGAENASSTSSDPGSTQDDSGEHI